MKTFQFTHTAIADLCHQLALLLKAGVSVADGLYLLAEEEPDPQVKTILSSVAGQVDQGIFLSSAFEEAGCFPSHVIGLLHVGEQAGRTEETLLALSRYYENRARMNRQLRNALTYPAVLILMMVVVIVVLLSQVLPVFDDIYASLGGSLTGVAGSLLALGDVIRRALPLLGALLALIVLAVLLFSLVPSLRSRVLQLWQRHFGDRGISRKMNDARFAQALSMAFSSGLPLEEGISMAATLLADCPAAVSRCTDCQKRLLDGEELASALSQSAMLPPFACRMLTLSMRAGTGDATMEEIARRLSEEAEEALQARLSMVEPALVLITSLLVGAILLSVMLPLMNIMKAIG